MEPLRKLFCPAFILLGFTVYFAEGYRNDPVANLQNSQILGKAVTTDSIDVDQYLGVPYAAPPIRDLRFKKPKPPRIPEVFPAYDYPTACWQKSSYPFPWYDSSDSKSEDCLYLNIWAPPGASRKNPKAVIFWIYTGGLRFGSNQLEVYYGAPLASLGDVVVVTVNYRLGALGFFTTDTDDAPGNIGLWDILEALKWVNQNIAAFGGDTSKITIAGNGPAVGLLSTSPLAKDLFTRQILQSGSSANQGSGNKATNLNLSQQIAEKLGCVNQNGSIHDNSSAVLHCLKKLQAEAITDVEANINPHSTINFLPQFGDTLLPTNGQESIRNGSFKCKQAIVGVTLDQGSHQLTTGDPDKFGFFGQLNPLIDRPTGEKYIRKFFRNFPDVDAVVNHYLTNDTLPPPSDAIRRQTYTASGDYSVLCPSVYYAEKCADGGGDVFFYVWRHRPSNSPWAPWMGVTFFSDVPFVFGEQYLRPREVQVQEETQLSVDIIKLWSSFAKDGKPSSSWPLYTKGQPQLNYLGPGDSTSEIGSGIHSENCDFFRPFYGF